MKKKTIKAQVQPVVMPRLIDHGDGVKGHFCIGRSMDGICYEFWSDKYKWSSAGTVFVGRKKAEAMLNKLA